MLAAAATWAWATAVILVAVALGTWGLTVFVAWRLAKGGGGAALSEYERANKRLEQSLRESREEQATLQTKLARLEGQTNVAIAMTPVLDWAQMHEQRAQERQAALIVVLDLIAQRLGPDPNGATHE